MKLLHITPHLGGGIGKAHAALSGVLLKSAFEQTYLLLEEPVDQRHVNTLLARGRRVIVGNQPRHVAKLVGEADIVQFDFAGHPRTYVCLTQADLPPMRSIIWSHVSGLFRPYIHPGMVDEADRFVFTTRASVNSVSSDAWPLGGVEVINSGFGFDHVPKWELRNTPAITYLGTVDFAKMHPCFFSVIDQLQADVVVKVWGKPSVDVKNLACGMGHPERIEFCGHTEDPAAALAQADIFFYPLQPHHFGTGENALVEAMAMGLAPVVLNNPAERQIVSHGETGIIAESVSDCVNWLNRLLVDKPRRERLASNAKLYVSDTRTPAHAAKSFTELWGELLHQPKRVHNFGTAIGNTALEWFLGAQGVNATEYSQAANKGGLEHFRKICTSDSSLAVLG